VSIYPLISFAAAAEFLFLKRYSDDNRWKSSTNTREAQKVINILNIFSISA